MPNTRLCVAAVLNGDAAGQQALSAPERSGLRLFIGKGQCSTCHNGPLLADQHFRNTGVPPRDASRPDRGRSDDPGMEGAFKTPGLRNVAHRAPDMHAGQLASLDDVVAHYVHSPKSVTGHSKLAHAGSGHAERKPIRLTDEEARDAVAFLKALGGPLK